MLIPSKEFIDKFKECNGAFSVSEAIALYNIVFDAPEGQFIELGSHKGKSSMVIALGMKPSSKLDLVEPEFKDHEWNKEVGKRVSAINGGIYLKLIADFSLNIIKNYTDLAFVFVDSGVHDDMVIDESMQLEDRVKQGGIIAFHDKGNQFTSVTRAYDMLLSTGKYEEIPIDWPRVFDYVRENNLEEGNNSWHEKGSEEFPKFVGALRRK